MSSLSSPTACPLLKTPPEIVDKIFDGLAEPRDRVAFASTCEVLLHRYYLPAVLSQLRRHQVYCWEEGHYTRIELFCLANAVKGQPGYGPFFISYSTLSSDRTRIKIRMTSPKIERSIAGVPTRSYHFLNLEGNGRAVMFEDYSRELEEIENRQGVFIPTMVDDEYWNDSTEGVVRERAPLSRNLNVPSCNRMVDWREVIAGQMVPATVELVKKRIVCVECKGSGTAKVTLEMLNRWPDLYIDDYLQEDHLDWPICCPRCGSYQAAIEELEGQMEKFEVSLPERMEEYDAMMQEMAEDEGYDEYEE